MDESAVERLLSEQRRYYSARARSTTTGRLPPATGYHDLDEAAEELYLGIADVAIELEGSWSAPGTFVFARPGVIEARRSPRSRTTILAIAWPP